MLSYHSFSFQYMHIPYLLSSLSLIHWMKWLMSCNFTKPMFVLFSLSNVLAQFKNRLLSCPNHAMLALLAVWDWHEMTKLLNANLARKSRLSVMSSAVEDESGGNALTFGVEQSAIITLPRLISYLAARIHTANIAMLALSLIMPSKALGFPRQPR